MSECDSDLQEKLSIHAARKSAFERSPAWFTVWDILTKILNTVFWLGFWLIIAQWFCDGCVF